jgi:hypothetical protein
MTERYLDKLSSVDFCYWLQGAIEIADLRGYTKEQAAKIKETIRRVDKPNGFVIGVNFALSFYPPEEAFKKIHKDLQAIFVHDIDPTYEGDQAHLLAVHQGKEEPVYQGKKPTDE